MAYSDPEKAKEYGRLYAEKRRARPEHAAYARAWYLRNEYGITSEQYDEMVARQRGLCAICGHAPAGKGAQGRLHVDHDHETGRVRGLLCSPCNRALGKLGDDEEGLMRALAYLRGEN